jgi:phytoene dehydrogenase-like protein
MDVRESGLDSGNIWLMDEGDMDSLFEKMQRSDITSGKTFEGMFISCTTLKDPASFDGRHHTLEVITYIDYSAFEKFENENSQRSQAYIDFKENLTQKMLNTLEKVIPNVRNHIVNQELGTPITNEYYINATRGSVYGTEKSLGQIGPFAFKPKSEIKNLFLCGASISSHGIAGASYSGVQTAGIILNKRQDDLIQADPLQNVNLFDAEDPTEYPDWLKNKIKVRQDRLASKPSVTK